MKYAMCQELFVDWPWERQCEYLAETGYTGIEVAPFTLAGRAEEVTPDKRNWLRSVAQDHGLTVIGLHWLLAKTEGFHLTTADDGVRAATAAYFQELTDLCADLGGTIMVLGSPQQRNLEAAMTTETAMSNAAEVINGFTERLADRGVTLAIEPLARTETDFLTTCAEGAELVEMVDHPKVQLHQDVKAMLDDSIPIPELIEQYADITVHFHANDGNLLGPGMGDTDFGPIFAALQQTGYDGWVSVEVFDYSPGAETIAEKSLNYMRQYE